MYTEIFKRIVWSLMSGFESKFLIPCARFRSFLLRKGKNNEVIHVTFDNENLTSEQQKEVYTSKSHWALYECQFHIITPQGKFTYGDIPIGYSYQLRYSCRKDLTCPGAYIKD